MSEIERFANYVDSDVIVDLFDKYQKHLGDNRTLAAKECGITPKSVYDWENRSEDVKYSTKMKILEKIIEELPVETFQYITDNLYNSSTETLLTCLSTLYEQAYDTKSEKEYLSVIHMFESITKKYAGLIYNNRELEVNGMFLKLSDFAKKHGYVWTPKQTVLYDLNKIKQIIPQIISSWIYHGLPLSAEELASRTKFPLEVVTTVGSTLNQQLLMTPPPSENILDNNIRAGVFLTGSNKIMMSEYALIDTSGSSISSSTRKSQLQLGV